MPRAARSDTPRLVVRAPDRGSVRGSVRAPRRAPLPALFALAAILCGFLAAIAAMPSSAEAGGTAKKYILSMHTCDRGLVCNDIVNHVVYFADSNDGVNWSQISGFPSFSGSVADSEVRANELYVYHFTSAFPGRGLRVIDIDTGTQTSSTPFTVRYTTGDAVSFVDPSLVVDPDTGYFRMFYIEHLVPGGCGSYPCDLSVRSATEVPGTEGKQFVQDPGERHSFYMATTGDGLYTDPDVFAGPSGYKMLVSNGATVYAYESADMTGDYVSIPGLTNDLLTMQGGVPSGHYDADSGDYWIYVNDNDVPSNIKVAVTGALTSELLGGDFQTAMNQAIYGAPMTSSDDVSSPGFVVNVTTDVVATGASPVPLLAGVFLLLLGVVAGSLGRVLTRGARRTA